MRRFIGVLGLVNALLLGGHAALSYVEAGAAGYDDRPYGHIVFYTRIGERISRFVMEVTPRPLLLGLLRRGPDGRGSAVGLPHEDEALLRTFERRVAWAIGGDWMPAHWFIDFYAWPMLLSTGVVLLALVVMSRTSHALDPGFPRQLLRWSVVFVVVMSFALPVLVQDLWLSVAWGRTLWWGGNPYYDVPAAAVAGLPFDAPILRMTYGPLWALIAWAVAAMTGASVLGSAVAFKALLVVSWCAVLWLVSRLVESRSLWERCAAILVVGWLPLGPVQIGGDGHNDVLMLVGMLSWLLLLRRGQRRWATVALALSVGVKYVTAPLFLIDLMHARTGDGPKRTVAGMVRAYLPNAAIAVGIWAVLFAPFLDSAAFFRETAAVREGYFYLPSDAVFAIGALLDVNLRPLAFAVQGAFPVATLVCLWRYWTRPGDGTLLGAAAGVMLSVLFVAAGHVWPWYVLWLSVPAAALRWSSPLARWSVGVALTAPFPLVIWVAQPLATEFRRFEAPSLFAYGGALLWMVLAWRAVTPPSLRANTPWKAGSDPA